MKNKQCFIENCNKIVTNKNSNIKCMMCYEDTLTKEEFSKFNICGHEVCKTCFRKYSKCPICSKFFDDNQLENGKKSPIISMNECGICLEEKLSKDKFIKLKNCDHQVCKTCYDNIIKTNPKCPFCAKWFDKPIGS
jgi:hypothetical protein